MPISQLTRSPKSWQKYKKRKSPLKRLNFNFFKKSKWDIKSILPNLIIVCIIGCLAGGIIFVGLIAWYSHDLPDPNEMVNRVVPESTKILDRTGKTILWEMHGGERRTIVELDQISDYIKWATISAEDKNFYKHKGFKITSIIRSIIFDILSGSRAQGGSTITQQLVKNVILTREKKISRKLKELILSYQIEKKFTKDQILKMYFNQIPYGSVNYGVESAANYYLGKHASDVTLAEAAILAALPQAPTRLSPFGSHVDELFNRQKWILNEMAQDGYITQEEADSAKAEKVTFSQENVGGIIAPHFVFYIKEILAEKYGEETLEKGGLKITSTLDLEKQKIAEDAVHNANEKNLTYKATNAALLSVDAKTGEILAMVGSQDFNNNDIDGQVNVTIKARQPGSSIKPIIYAAAFEKGFTTETVLYDAYTIFAKSPKEYAPRNYNKKEYGPITLRRALAGSLNIPAVKTLYLAGYENVKNLMKNMGYSTITDESQCGLALVLGGCEVKLIDHVGAFTAFARDGERSELAGILKVEDKTGKILEEFQPKKHKVLSESSVRQINSILSDDGARSFIFGSGSPLVLKDRPVCAKTGTTNDNKDAWAIGYTPSFVTGVWVGNNRGESMSGSADGVVVAAPIWHEYMAKILSGTPVEYFKEPEPLDTSLPAILRGQMPGEVEVEIDRASGKLATEYTPITFREKKKFTVAHDILFYIDKDNPAGPPPTNPSSDPMFQWWEDGVKQWYEKQAQESGQTYIFEEPPTTTDDVHVPINFPTITLLSPANQQLIESNPVNFQVQVSAPRALSRVVYEIDGINIGTSYMSPYNLTTTLNGFAHGYHKLKVTAYDDIDNSSSVEIELNLKYKI
ncbi:PBP1A family penicillin-binding protein [Candidatus Falkowbacteria bacterium]|nr:PBP1A family penicillin-binding protein [Candidatus Falkowbacteria bacterium]